MASMEAILENKKREKEQAERNNSQIGLRQERWRQLQNLNTMRKQKKLKPITLPVEYFQF